MKTAIIQFNAGVDKKENIRRSSEFVIQAAAKGAKLVVLPEIFSFRGNMLDEKTAASSAEAIPGETVRVFEQIAMAHKTAIILGSLMEKTAGKPFNTSVFISDDGRQIVKYRKMHLFDAVVDGKIIREENFFSKGELPVQCCSGDWRIGLSICYDLRFPSMYQHYAAQGVNILAVPSCFTRTTGQAHWESLLRARAIENLSFVLAPNQVGVDARGVQAHGHSMIVSPWGEILAEGSGDKEEILMAELSIEIIKQARAKLPGIVKE